MEIHLILVNACTMYSFQMNLWLSIYECHGKVAFDLGKFVQLENAFAAQAQTTGKV